MPFSSPISQLLGDTHSDIREFLLSACYSAIVHCQYASPTNAIAASFFFRKCCVVSPLFQSGKIERSNCNDFCRTPKKKILLFSGVVELVASKTLSTKQLWSPVLFCEALFTLRYLPIALSAVTPKCAPCLQLITLSLEYFECIVSLEISVIKDKWSEVIWFQKDITLYFF